MSNVTLCCTVHVDLRNLQLLADTAACGSRCSTILTLQLSDTTLHCMDVFLPFVIDTGSKVCHAGLALDGRFLCIGSARRCHLGDLGIKKFIGSSYETLIVIASTRCVECARRGPCRLATAAVRCCCCRDLNATTGITAPTPSWKVTVLE